MKAKKEKTIEQEGGSEKGNARTAEVAERREAKIAKKKSGVCKVAVVHCTPPHFLKNVMDAPPHVVITSLEDSGYVQVEVPEDGYYDGTTEDQKQFTRWILRGVPPQGPNFTKLEASGDLIGKGGKVGLYREQCGSAVYWIEPFIKSPRNKGPNGFFLSGYCEAKITKVSWHKYQEDNGGPEVQAGDEIAFGDLLQVRIETEGLNGDSLEVSIIEGEHNTIIDSTTGQTFGGLLIINVPIKLAWRAQLFNWFEKITSSDFELTVQIENERLETNFKGSPITVKNEIAERKMDKGCAVPVTIGKIAIDERKYDLCKYVALKVKTADREYVVFENGKQKEPRFEVVAGAGKASEVSIILNECNTKGCSDISCHEGRVLTIDIPDIPEVKYVEVEEKFSDTEAKENEKEEKELTDGSSFTTVEGEISNKGTLMGISKSHKSELGDKDVDFASVQKSDEELTFNARYNYGNIDGNTSLNAFRYFWVTRATPQVYRVKAETCAYKHDISIAAYPDIKWILQFKFNSEEKDFAKIKRPDAKIEPTAFEDKDEKAVASSKAVSKKKKGNLKGLIEIFERMEISLSAEWDGGNEVRDFSKDFAEKVFRIFGAIAEASEMIVKVVEGKHVDRPKNTPEEMSIDKFMASIKREPVELEVLYPSLAFAGAWFLEEVKDEKLDSVNRQALSVEVDFTAKPLIGFELKWDLLELLCRKHPVAYIVLKIVDGLLELLTDKESEIKVDFSVTGKMDFQAKLKHNLLAGNALGNGYSSGKEEEVISSKEALTVKLEAKLNLSKTKYVFQYGVVTSFEVGASVEAGLGMISSFGVDIKGVYFSRKVFFEGLKLSIYAKGKVEVENADTSRPKKPIATPQEGKKEKTEHDKLIDAGFEFKGEVTFAKHEGAYEKVYITTQEKV